MTEMFTNFNEICQKDLVAPFKATSLKAPAIILLKSPYHQMASIYYQAVPMAAPVFIR